MRIFVTRRLPEGPQKKLDAIEGAEVETSVFDRPLTPEELLRGAAGAHILVCQLQDTVDVSLIKACPNLRLVATYSVGYNHIDVAACRERGIAVVNTPGILTETTADLGWALIMSAARRVVEADRYVRARAFKGWAPTLLLGLPVHGQTLGIIGMGAIGGAVARRARGFSMRVLYHNRTPSPCAAELGAELCGLADLLARADFVVLCCPLTPATRHIIGAAELGAMKPSAVLVNIARGPCVDERALVTALRDGTIAAAGLDVYEHEPDVTPELMALDNVVLLPHIGSGTTTCRDAMALRLVEACAQCVRGAAVSGAL